MRYYSKRDWAMKAIIAAVWLIGIAVLFFMYTDDSATFLMIYVFGPMLVFGLVLVTASITNMYYELQEEGLYVKAGFYSYFFPYETMESIHPIKGFYTPGVKAAMALTGVAIKVNDGRELVRISPDNEASFRAELMEKAPHVKEIDEAISQREDKFVKSSFLMT
ncbi:PH domain-containing protein [Shouchella clausii]|uniref:PH domain-containing protein n=1 Tax=Shouchella clausii TaxID=79880 RepID=UPI00311F61E6